MVDYADIGKRIRACRLAKGMTQEQLANEVGVVVTPRDTRVGIWLRASARCSY